MAKRKNADEKLDSVKNDLEKLSSHIEAELEEVKKAAKKSDYCEGRHDTLVEIRGFLSDIVSLIN